MCGDITGFALFFPSQFSGHSVWLGLSLRNEFLFSGAKSPSFLLLYKKVAGAFHDEKDPSAIFMAGGSKFYIRNFNFGCARVV